jgi:hypothetical protein
VDVLERDGEEEENGFPLSRMFFEMKKKMKRGRERWGRRRAGEQDGRRK